MNYLDYREKLGIGFSDQEKINIFYQRMRNRFQEFVLPMMDNSDYYEFCDCIGVAYKYSEADHLLECFYEYVDIERNFNNYIYKYVMLMNSMSHHEEYYCTSEYLRDIIETQLSAVSIPYEIIKDDDGYFIFPKGAEELDKTLISENLLWLKDYPKSRKEFEYALRTYSDNRRARDIADNLRKVLEMFFQEYLDNDKNLITNKTEMYRYFGENGADSEINTMFASLISTLDSLNNKKVKHNDGIKESSIEFLLYLTGAFIRFAITLRNNESENKE